MNRRKSSAPVPAKVRTVELPDGRRLDDGDEFTVRSKDVAGRGGRFRFRYVADDGSLAAFGPVGANVAKWRAFRPELVATVHRTRKETRS